MGVELVVLDFDGTLTDVDQEAIPFVDGYQTDLAIKLDVSGDQLRKSWEKTKSVIELNQSQYGWVMNGQIVAPAYADPLIMSRTIAGLLLKEEGITDENRRNEILDLLFKGNYDKLGTNFKEGADDLLKGIEDQFAGSIVTNSGTNGVTRKIQQLPTDHSIIPIYGDAKKYVLQQDWEEVPESLKKAGFGRPLFLRRQLYWKVLQKIMEERGLTPEQVAVVGDIYELDLLLPEHKGMHTILTPRHSTPEFEIDAVKSHNRGYVARDLEGVLEHLRSLR